MLPLSATQIKSIYADAMKHLGAGRLAQAETGFRQVLAASPKLSEAHFQLGRIALMRSDPAQALRHLREARAIKPGESAIWQLMAEAALRLNDKAAAETLLKEAKQTRLGPQLLLTLQNRLSAAASGTGPSFGKAPPDEVQAAIRALEAGDIAEAERRAAALLLRFPDVAIIALILANSQFRQGKLAEAEQSYRTAIRLGPNYAEAHNTFGRFLVEQDRLDEGIARLNAALKLEPNLPLGLQNLGVALARKGDSRGAIEVLRRALATGERLVEAPMVLGRQLTTVGEPEEAVEVFRKAIADGRNEAAFFARMAQAQAKTGDDAAALESFDEAVRRGPQNGLVHSLRAMFLQSIGRFEEAERDFRTAIALEPKNGENYRTFLATSRLEQGDPMLKQMEEVYADPSLPEESRTHLAFALARAMEQTRQYDRVFGYLDTANAFWRKRYPYDIAHRRAEIDKLKAAFATVDFATARPAAGATDFAPIFVTGMPRSGTTLVEQILASHSRVEGAGEVGVMSREVMRKLLLPDNSYRLFSALPEADIADLGRQAEARLRALCPGAERVVDKAIQTYLVMGAVKLALPNAHIVLVRRDPRDTLVSIYKNVFSEGTHRYAYNQRDLGLYYRMFEEMVDFWRARLPGGFHEIRYEDLIERPEEESRRLIAACGLEWEDQCLNFHQTERKVATLSMSQVRQPIYKSSQALWKRYEPYIGEMIEALGDAVDAWD